MIILLILIVQRWIWKSCYCKETELIVPIIGLESYELRNKLYILNNK